jgi:hypothetical protein
VALICDHWGILRERRRKEEKEKEKEKREGEGAGEGEELFKTLLPADAADALLLVHNIL